MFWCCQQPSDDGDVLVQTNVVDFLNENTGNSAGPSKISCLQDDPAEQPPQSWLVVLAKPPDRSPLGLELEIDVQQRLEMLTDPKTGPALEWNLMHPGASLRGGDVVEAVNGITGDAQELLTEIGASEVLELRMMRLVDFTVNVDKRTVLGIEVQERDGRVVVEKVFDEGEIRRHNAKCLAGYRVTPGNWLTAINGTSGTAQDLMQKLQGLEDGMVGLRFRRARPSR